jgi:hypothetical protein
MALELFIHVFPKPCITQQKGFIFCHYHNQTQKKGRKKEKRNLQFAINTRKL